MRSVAITVAGRYDAARDAGEGGYGYATACMAGYGRRRARRWAGWGEIHRGAG